MPKCGRVSDLHVNDMAEGRELDASYPGSTFHFPESPSSEYFICKRQSRLYFKLDGLRSASLSLSLSLSRGPNRIIN